MSNAKGLIESYQQLNERIPFIPGGVKLTYKGTSSDGDHNIFIRGRGGASTFKVSNLDDKILDRLSSGRRVNAEVTNIGRGVGKSLEVLVTIPLVGSFTAIKM